MQLGVSVYSPYDNQTTYKSKKPFTWRVIAICLGSFIFGYCFTYFTAIGCSEIEEKIHDPDFYYFLLLGMIPLFAIVGSFLSTILNKLFSRTNTICIAGLIGCIGTVILLFGNSKKDGIDQFVRQPRIWIGRSIQGIAVGIYSVICPIFIKQLVPIELAVNFGVLHQLMISIGTLVAKLFAQFHVQPWILFSFPLPIILLQMILMKTVFKFETAKYWLLIQQQDKARSFYSHLYNQGYAEELFLDLRTTYRLQIQDSSFMNLDYNIESIRKKALFIGIYVGILQQLSGVTYITTFGIYPDRCQTSIKYNDTGFEVIWTALMCISTFFLVITNQKCCPSSIKRTNKRRVLFQQGTIGSVFFILIIICLLPPFDESQKHIYAIQIVITLLMINYGWTLGPTTWLYLSQILQNQHIAKAMSANFSMRFFLISFFPLIGRNEANNKQIIFSCLMILLPLLCIAIFINHKLIVQTKNRHRIDIVRDIDALKFPCNLFN